MKQVSGGDLPASLGAERAVGTQNPAGQGFGRDTRRRQPPGTDVALAADRDAVVALWHACGLTRPWNDPVADYDRAVSGASSAILLVRDDDAIIGSVMVGDDGHRGWVYYLAVAPDRRRGGIGRTLMAAAEAWLRDRGCVKIQLMVRDDNLEAAAFYRSLGLERQKVATYGGILEDRA